MWTLGANAVSDEMDDEEARATWPTPPPEMEEPTSGVELAHRLVRLRAGDRSREVIVDEAIDAALADLSGLRRVVRYRDDEATTKVDADRLKDLFFSIISDVARGTLDDGEHARAIIAHTSIDVRAARVVVEIADLRRVFGDAIDLDEDHARATDAVTGVVLCISTHPALGRVARIEIPIGAA